MVGYHTLLSLRELARRAQYLDGQLARLGQLITPLVTARAPGLLSLFGVGPDTAAMLLIATGDRPSRLRSEARGSRARKLPTRPVTDRAGSGPWAPLTRLVRPAGIS